MKKRLTREDLVGAVILASVFFLVFVLPALVGGAPPVLACGGLAAFFVAHVAGVGKQRNDAGDAGVALEPLPADHLLELKRLWRDPDVVRYTHIPDLCGPAEVTGRLERLLDCQTALPGPTIFAVLRDGRTMDIWDYVRSPGMKKEERL